MSFSVFSAVDALSKVISSQEKVLTVCESASACLATPGVSGEEQSCVGVYIINEGD